MVISGNGDVDGTRSRKANLTISSESPVILNHIVDKFNNKDTIELEKQFGQTDPPKFAAVRINSGNGEITSVNGIKSSTERNGARNKTNEKASYGTDKPQTRTNSEVNVQSDGKLAVIKSVKESKSEVSTESALRRDQLHKVDNSTKYKPIAENPKGTALPSNKVDGRSKGVLDSDKTTKAVIPSDNRHTTKANWVKGDIIKQRLRKKLQCKSQSQNDVSTAVRYAEPFEDVNNEDDADDECDVTDDVERLIGADASGGESLQCATSTNCQETRSKASRKRKAAARRLSQTEVTLPSPPTDTNEGNSNEQRIQEAFGETNGTDCFETTLKNNPPADRNYRKARRQSQESNSQDPFAFELSSMLCLDDRTVKGHRLTKGSMADPSQQPKIKTKTRKQIEETQSAEHNTHNVRFLGDSSSESEHGEDKSETNNSPTKFREFMEDEPLKEDLRHLQHDANVVILNNSKSKDEREASPTKKNKKTKKKVILTSFGGGAGNVPSHLFHGKTHRRK